MRHVVYSVNCPGCSKRIHAPSEEKRRAAVIRHIRNCSVLKRDASLLVPESDLKPAEQMPG